jgi:MYXO-CTERM domain-containing protein
VGYYITSPQNEISYMYYVNLGNPGYFIFDPVDPGENFQVESGCYVDGSDTCLDNVGPFSNLQPHFYWNATGESSQYPAGYEGDGIFFTKYGNQWLGPVAFYTYYGGGNVWAVSSGDVGIAAVPEADTWPMLLAGLALVGAASRRRRG